MSALPITRQLVAAVSQLSFGFAAAACARAAPKGSKRRHASSCEEHLAGSVEDAAGSRIVGVGEYLGELHIGFWAGPGHIKRIVANTQFCRSRRYRPKNQHMCRSSVHQNNAIANRAHAGNRIFC
jgi:hypothetical protein